MGGEREEAGEDGDEVGGFVEGVEGCVGGGGGAEGVQGAEGGELGEEPTGHAVFVGVGAEVGGLRGLVNCGMGRGGRGVYSEAGLSAAFSVGVGGFFVLVLFVLAVFPVFPVLSMFSMFAVFPVLPGLLELTSYMLWLLLR